MVGRCVVCVLHGAERQKCAPGVQMAMPRLWHGPDGKAFSGTCITSVLAVSLYQIMFESITKKWV